MSLLLKPSMGCLKGGPPIQILFRIFMLTLNYCMFVMHFVYQTLIILALCLNMFSNLVQITHTHNMVNINNQLIRGPLIRSHCENSRPVICLNLLRLLLIYSSVLRPSQSSFANLLFLILVIRYNTNKKVPLYNLITNI